MSITITVPSKTFVLGEYTALTGGPALVLCTEPRFKLIASPVNDKIANFYQHISPDSPAGKYIKLNWSFYKDYQINFIDPYQGAGGLGASSAQFAMIYKMKSVLLNESSLSINSLLEEYRTVAWNNKGLAPSGADLIAQYFGNICYFNRAENVIETYQWPFKDIAICLIRTGNKIATHAYLEKLTLPDTEQLSAIVYQGLEYLKVAKQQEFIKSISEFNQELQNKDLISEKTKNLLAMLRHRPEVLSAKGCGAKGADIILSFIKKEAINYFRRWAKAQQLKIYSEVRLSSGIEVLMSSD